MGPYTIATIIAVLVVSVGTYIAGVRRGIPPLKMVTLIAAFIFFTFIGARIFYLITNLEKTTVSFWDIKARGFSLFGGLILSALGGGIACYLLKVDRWIVADIVAPFLGIGIAIMRIGCFMYGCCFGKETALPWGVSFPLGSPAHLYQLRHPGGELLFVHPVHPTQLYELSAVLIGTLLALYITQRKTGRGIAFLAFISWFSVFRLINSSLRVRLPHEIAPSYFYPLLYLTIIMICFLLIKRRIKKSQLP